MATQNLPPSRRTISTAHPETNLDTFNRAYAAFSTDQQVRFVSYFIGAISVAAPSNEWNKALSTALRLMSAGKSASSASLPLFDQKREVSLAN